MVCRWCREPKDPELEICFPCIFPEVRQETDPEKRATALEHARTQARRVRARQAARNA